MGTHKNSVQITSHKSEVPNHTIIGVLNSFNDLSIGSDEGS